MIAIELVHAEQTNGWTNERPNERTKNREHTENSR